MDRRPICTLTGSSRHPAGCSISAELAGQRAHGAVRPRAISIWQAMYDAFAWSGRRPSRSIGPDVGVEKQGGSLLRCYAGNRAVKTEARRRISGTMRVGLEQLAASRKVEGRHVSSLE